MAQWTNIPVISKVQLPGSEQTYWFKDADARAAIEALGNAMHFMGVATNNQASEDDWTISLTNPTETWYITPPQGQQYPQSGDVVICGSREVVCTTAGAQAVWEVFGDITHLDTQKTVVTVNGTLAADAISGALTKTTDSVLGADTTFTAQITNGTAINFGTDTVNKVTTATNAPIYNLGNAKNITINGAESQTPADNYVQSVTTGNLKGITSVTAEGASKVTGGTEKTFVATAAINDTATDGVNTVGTVSTMKLATGTTLPVSGTTTVHDTPTLNTENIGSASGWNAGTMTTLNVAAFNGGSKVADTFSAGTMTTLNVAAFNGGAPSTLTAAQNGTFAIKTANFTVDNNELLSISWAQTSDTSFYSTAVTDRGTFTEGSAASLGDGFYNEGTAPSFQEGAFTPASLGDGFYNEGTAPSLTITSTAVGTGLTAGDAITVATAGTNAITFATGELNSNGSGADVVTGVTSRYLHTGTDTVTGNYTINHVALPVADDNASTVVTGATVKSMTIEAASGADTVSDVAIVGSSVNVATNSTNVSVMPATAGVSITVGTDDPVTAITGITGSTAINFTASETGDGHKHAVINPSNN